MVSSATNLGAIAAKRYLQINTDHATRATEQLASGSIASNPSYDPSSSAVGYTLTASIQSLTQASSNVSQATAMIQMATGSLGATQDVLTRLKELTVKANTNTVGDSERQMMNNEFQQLISQVSVNAESARWGGVSLFAGGAGTATADGAVTQAATTLLAPTTTANSFAATLNAGGTQGNLTGYAVDATVTANGSLFDVSVTISDQTFKATVGVPTASGVLTLVSVSDPATSISLDYGTAGASLTTAALFQSNLQETLGIGTGLARASFVSTSVAAPAGLTLSAGAGTDAGTWALTYAYDATSSTGTFRVSDGSSFYVASATASNSMTTTVSFSNGISLALSAFDGTANIPPTTQSTWTVVAGEQLDMSFQYGDQSSDMLEVTFKGATADALKLTGLTILTLNDAASAGNIIDGAQQQIGSMIAELGGKASQLGFMADTLKISIQNQTAARSAFIDADIADSMLALQQFKGLAQVASSVFTQALNEQSQLTSMVQNVR